MVYVMKLYAAKVWCFPNSSVFKFALAKNAKQPKSLVTPILKYCLNFSLCVYEEERLAIFKVCCKKNTFKGKI